MSSPSDFIQSLQTGQNNLYIITKTILASSVQSPSILQLSYDIQLGLHNFDKLLFTDCQWIDSTGSIDDIQFNYNKKYISYEYQLSTVNSNVIDRNIYLYSIRFYSSECFAIQINNSKVSRRSEKLFLEKKSNRYRLDVVNLCLICFVNKNSSTNQIALNLLITCSRQISFSFSVMIFAPPLPSDE